MNAETVLFTGGLLSVKQGGSFMVESLVLAGLVLVSMFIWSVVIGVAVGHVVASKRVNKWQKGILLILFLILLCFINWHILGVAFS